MPEHIRRAEKLVTWCLELDDKWQKSPATLAFLKQHPKVEAMREVAMIMDLVNILTARIVTRTFDCKDPYFKIFADIRRLYAEGRNGNTAARLRMRDKRTVKKLNHVALNSVAARYSKYVLKKYCNMEMAGEVNMVDYTGYGMSPEEYETREIREVVFIDEIKMLEEQLND